jgi:hypothetical protein
LAGVAFGFGRYAGAHAEVQAEGVPGCVVEWALCAAAVPASRGRGTELAQGVAFVAAWGIAYMAVDAAEVEEGE